MRAAPLLLTATLLLGSSAATTSAQAPTSATPPLSHEVLVLPATRLAALADSLPAGALNSVQIGRWEGLTNSLGRRDSAGVHERHEGFTDIFVVQRGSATLRYGGTADGEKLTTPGEWRGGTIRNGSEAVLRPGDIVVIPAGIPHQLLPGAGEHFVYLAFKVAKAPKP
jgi:mannose-6-phosphate isomerase-like protein (cupin superfamily)